MSDSFFVVLEGLDGSGKTQLSRALKQTLQQTHGDDVALTFEPHDPSSAGLYTRQVLTKRIKNVQPRTLALGFALNRADHNDRVIEPFLNGGPRRILLCDRYYLSSLVYQSVAPLSMADVRLLNRGARQPDLTLFLDASPHISYERMSKRPADRELFEENLERTRHKYYEGIDLLREAGERVVVINADGTFDEVLRAALDALQQYGPDWLKLAPPTYKSSAEPSPLDQLDPAARTLDLLRGWRDRAGDDLTTFIDVEIDALPYADVAALFLGYLAASGYRLGERLPWTENVAWLVEIDLPLGMTQRGAALLLPETQGNDQITRRLLALLDQASSLADVQRVSDFLVVLDAAPMTDGVTYERDASGERISPSVRIVQRGELARFALQTLSDMNRTED
jgi:dTMP kinase